MKYKVGQKVLVKGEVVEADEGITVVEVKDYCGVFSHRTHLTYLPRHEFLEQLLHPLPKRMSHREIKELATKLWVGDKKFYAGSDSEIRAYRQGVISAISYMERK